MALKSLTEKQLSLISRIRKGCHIEVFKTGKLYSYAIYDNGRKEPVSSQTVENLIDKGVLRMKEQSLELSIIFKL